ncbi:MAG: hypothetical protein IKB71_08320, partial [Lentisphaeria bacterium]|nr:hypothetical protein [Lentisphaeria bacterium]
IRGEQALFLYAVALTILRCKNTQRAFAKAIADQKAGGTPPRTPSFFFIISQCLVQSQKVLHNLLPPDFSNQFQHKTNLFSRYCLKRFQAMLS